MTISSSFIRALGRPMIRGSSGKGQDAAAVHRALLHEVITAGEQRETMTKALLQHTTESSFNSHIFFQLFKTGVSSWNNIFLPTTLLFVSASGRRVRSKARDH